MIVKAFAALVAAPFLLSAMDAPARTEEGISPDTRPEVVRIQCLLSSGSAFYIGPKTLVSVAHVTDAPGCHINGKPFRVVQRQDDFSILAVEEPSAHWMKIDCGGFVPGEKYTAWGYARGLYTLTSVDITAKGNVLAGFSRLWGVFNVIPGQSGGPITPVSDPHRAVGSVNVYNAAIGDSGSTALKDTSLCRA